MTVKNNLKKHEKKFVLCSIASLLWLHRSLFKPSRYDYPCQRFARTQSFLFFSLYAIPIATRIKNKSLNAIRYVKSRKLIKDAIIVLAIFLILFTISSVYDIVQQKIYGENFRKKYPSGFIVEAQSSNHRVVRVHTNDATSWDFSGGYYWEYVDQATVDQMVEEGVKAFTGTSTEQEAWQTILTGYSSGQIVGIKINGNDFPGFANNQNYINTLPQVINAVIKGVKSIGVPESDIWVIEPTGSSNGYRTFYSYYYTIINGLYPDVQLLDGNDISFGTYSDYPDLLVDFPDPISDRYITDQMADIDYLINIPIMKAITTYWGITGAIKSMQGNIQDQGGLHDYLDRTTADNPNVIIYQNQHIIGKTRLIVGDGLYGMWTGMHFPESSDDIPQPWQIYGNNAPNFLFFAIDPVAIDCIMLDYINAERADRSLSTLPQPQLIAGETAGLGVGANDRGQIDYVEVELGESIPGSCDDTDGLDKYTKGTVSGYENGGQWYEHTDYCNENRRLQEYWCDGTSWDATTYSCPTGYYCSSGRCIKSSGGGGGGGCWSCRTIMIGIVPPEYQDLFIVGIVVGIIIFGSMKFIAKKK